MRLLCLITGPPAVLSSDYLSETVCIAARQGPLRVDEAIVRWRARDMISVPPSSSVLENCSFCGRSITPVVLRSLISVMIKCELNTF